MKKFLLLFVVVLMVIAPISVSAQSEIKVVLEGTEIEFDQPPVIISDRTMVPVRAIYEALGAEVSWDGATRTASGTKTGITVSFTIDEAKVVINYNEVEIDAPAVIVNDRTLVPVRALAEGFGVTVDWDAATRTVKLTNTNPPVETKIDGLINKVPTVYDYQGQINAENKPNGYGTAYFPDGRIFCGSFMNKYSKDGFLFYTSPESGIKTAQWYDEGKSTGYVEMEWPDGNVYKGAYKDGQFTGYGELYMADGSSYRGDWINGIFNGKGRYEWADGSWFEGDWVDGKRNGQGMYYDAKSRQSISGTWEDDVYVI